MSRCAIHQNAYDSSHICAACRRDPANADWVASVDAEAAANEPPRSARPRRAPPPSSCAHDWEPRSDLGRGCYTCRACAVPGRRSMRTGMIREHVRHPGYYEPPLTVDFKPIGDTHAHREDHAPALRPTYSTRSTYHKVMERTLAAQADVDARVAQYRPGHRHVWVPWKYRGMYVCECGQRARKQKKSEAFVELGRGGPAIGFPRRQRA